MVIADPNAELLGLVRSMGDPPPSDPTPPEPTPAARQQAQLIRRRFGLSLPTPFVGPPGPDEPVRVAVAADGAAVASVKWRVFGSSYRGILPDEFLDKREVVPPASFWIGRAMVPPSRSHRLLVWGRPGTVHGYLDCGPAHPDDASADLAFEREAVVASGAGHAGAVTGSGAGPVPRLVADEELDGVGEVWELYVDPAAQGAGGGARLLAAAEEWLDGRGLHHQVLSVLGGNVAAQFFYRSRGWVPTGREVPVDLGTVSFVEHRFRRG